ncbi:MAG: helix-hairpin-helix domain-containing protein [Oscillospiraceae bacterium]|nr:helix-hairpin-helix domain-containing protein [Oscillospiraceae bacterium]
MEERHKNIYEKPWIWFAVTFAAVLFIACFVWGISEFTAEENIPVIISADEHSSVTAVAFRELLVNINTADVKELMTVKGIGEATAEKIIAYREENGSFESVDELIEINGIGEKKLEQFRPYVVIEDTVRYVSR